MTNWPQRSDGTPKKIGEMSPVEKREAFAGAISRLKAELESPQMAAAVAKMFDPAEMVRDAEAQLAQVEARIAKTLEMRGEAAARGFSASTRRMVEQNLHGLYVLQHEIKADIARLRGEAS